MARKPHTYHYIYKTTCKVNGKYYIGMHSTSNLEDGYIGSGKRLRYSIRKHGKENHEFEILEFFPDRSSLKDREKQIVNESLLRDPMCMNLAIGGEGGYRGKEGQFKWSKSGGLAFSKKRKENTEIDREYREKLSYSRKENWKDPNYRGKFNFSGEHNPFYNRVHSQESRDKIGKANSISQKGEKNSQFGTKWIHSLDLKENKRISKEEEVPDGWKLGRKIKF